MPRQRISGQGGGLWQLRPLPAVFISSFTQGKMALQLAPVLERSLLIFYTVPNLHSESKVTSGAGVALSTLLENQWSLCSTPPQHACMHACKFTGMCTHTYTHVHNSAYTVLLQ